MERAYILIPALDPTQILVEYVHKLLDVGFQEILVIDDGSKESCKEVFEELKMVKECTVLKHAINLGKGRAIKNGLNYYLNMENSEQYTGIITVDSDGQHLVTDVLRLSQKMSELKDRGDSAALILGSRDFNLAQVPPKSRFGNKLTSRIFKILYGVKIKDTQTGLRAFHNNIIPEYIQLFGERFEYETGILIKTALNKISILEMDIATVYFEGNKETHFNPIKDSISIYSIIFKSFFRYIFASLSSFVIDIGIFQLLIIGTTQMGLGTLSERIVSATVCARIISSLLNFTLNKNLVFKLKDFYKSTILKYYILCVIQMLISAMLVALVCTKIHIAGGLVKMVVDSILFLISFRIQQKWVFSKRRNS